MNDDGMDGMRRAPLAFALAATLTLLLLLWYAGTVMDIVSVWDGSETYQHGYVVLPLCLWLLWRQRTRIVAEGFRPAWGALLPLALAGLAWSAGELAGVAVVEQFALAAMLICAVWCVWGHRAARVAAFPLGFLLFAVPFGEFLVPIMMQHTADFTVAALRWSGVPVYREGLSFVIPSGRWSVVEACSGIRYLIASVMVGALYAFMTYRSLSRRLLFVVASIVVPLIANWLRAYMIVMIGHLSSNRLAVGVDHIIYGWIFFGVVIFLLFWVGSFWREDDEPGDDASPSVVAPSAPTPSLMLMALCVLLLAGVWRPLAAWIIDVPVPVVAPLQAPTGEGGWQRSADIVAADWAPLYAGYAAQLNQSYRKGEDRVSLRVYYYVGQRTGHKLVQWDNRLVGGESRRWEIISEDSDDVPLGARRFIVRHAAIKGPASLQVWNWLWVDDRVTISDTAAKFSLLRDRIERRSDGSAAVLVATDAPEHRAKAVVEDFLQHNAAAIAALLKRAEQ